MCNRALVGVSAGPGEQVDRSSGPSGGLGWQVLSGSPARCAVAWALTVTPGHETLAALTTCNYNTTISIDVELFHRLHVITLLFQNLALSK